MKSDRNIATASLILAASLAVLAASACSVEGEAAKKRITPEYDKNGKLELLQYDSTGSGKVDTWSYMDGARVVRIEVDKDRNGTIDRWEYYRPDRQLDKVEISTRRDSKVDRVEYYEHDVMTRAEEDTDADGKMDKWETYDGARLASVAFDTLHRGLPDRRLTYGPGGTANMEVDLKGDGHFLPVRSGSAH